MIKFIGEDTKFTMVVGNERELLKLLEFKLNLLLGENNVSKYSVAYRTKIYDLILENIVLEEFIKSNNNNIDENKPYLISATLKDEHYKYLIANVNINEGDTGFVINKTLQN